MSKADELDTFERDERIDLGRETDPIENATGELYEYEPKLSLTGYQMECYRYAQWTGPGASNLGDLPPLVYCAIGIGDEAGEVLGKIKKLYRDREGDMDDATKQAIILELGDVLWYVGQMADMMGVTLGEVAQANLEKLEGRRKRGTLGGSGDDR